MTIRKIHWEHIIPPKLWKGFPLRVSQSRFQGEENNVQENNLGAEARWDNLQMTKEILFIPNPSLSRQHQRNCIIWVQIFIMKNLHKLQDHAILTASNTSRIVSLGPRVMVRDSIIKSTQTRNQFHNAPYLYQRVHPPVTNNYWTRLQRILGKYILYLKLNHKPRLGWAVGWFCFFLKRCPSTELVRW